MARRKIAFVPGYYYHLCNRGSNRAPIFRNPSNYIYLLRKIKKYLHQTAITMIVYCLMPNHYHFLVRQESNISVSDFIQSVFNSYTKAFNKAFDRSGSLFEGPFRAVLIEEDTHLLHLCRYIHLNPVEGGLVARPEDWLFSNYQEWVGKRSGTLCDPKFIKAHFPTPTLYEQFVIDYQPSAQVEDTIRYLALE